MITIEHHRESGFEIGGIPLVLGLAEYHAGLTKPNYPLPTRYHVSLDPDGLDTMDILANIIFHADNIFYPHDYDCVD